MEGKTKKHKSIRWHKSKYNKRKQERKSKGHEERNIPEENKRDVSRGEEKRNPDQRLWDTREGGGGRGEGRDARGSVGGINGVTCSGCTKELFISLKSKLWCHTGLFTPIL